MKNIDFFSAISFLTVAIPFDRAWSQEFKNVLLFVSIASYDEKSAAQGAKKEKGPILFKLKLTLIHVRGDVSKNETFWAHSDP